MICEACGEAVATVKIVKPNPAQSFQACDADATLVMNRSSRLGLGYVAAMLKEKRDK